MGCWVLSLTNSSTKALTSAWGRPILDLMPQTRISESGHRLLRRLSGDLGMSSEELLDRALDLLERRRALDAINAGYEELRADPEAWDGERTERRLWQT